MKIGPIFVAALFCVQMTAMFVQMPPVPMARLIPYTESVIRQNPDSPDAYYLLGRLHSLAFAMVTEVEADLRDGKPPVLAGSAPDRATRETSGRLKASDIDHANKSIANYKRAVELAPDSALYHFSLGWMEEQCSHFAGQLGSRSGPDWIDQALAEYRTAYRLALPADSKLSSHLRPYLADEAGTAILEILKQRSGSQEEIAEISKTVADLRRRPLAVTPLIFSLNSGAALPDLLSDRQVGFDLDGFGAGRRWPWVRPDTCILVWDPNRTGRITSGRQLFGSVTWWMFWRNGYEPLAALDDNRDGVLSGAELRGIAVWRDANSNGIADPGEVVPVEGFGIVEIAVKPRQIDGALQRNGGIKLRDGRSLTTFDWTPVSVGTDTASAYPRIRLPIAANSFIMALRASWNSLTLGLPDLR
ncbi:MAG TPA: hypothetical protein VGZ73_04600 [Bryobacteraceae bacterium]|nr:hypothetical protein [Bryobacteraceae bacterium]